MNTIQKFFTSLVAMILTLSSFSVSATAVARVPYTYTTPTNPYKYTMPTNPYRYSTPDNPYTYTTPTNPYKYTQPDNPYRYTTPTNPYKYTDPKNPLYKYTMPGGTYTDTDMQDDVACAQHPFTDIQGHPAESYIADLYCMGLVNGYIDGTFRPERTISRAELLKLSMMASGIEPHEDAYVKDAYFVDLVDWHIPWVNTGFELGIVEGYEGGDGFTYYYAPDNPVNRAEGIKLMLATFGVYPGDIQESSFVDVHGWMIPWIEVAYGLGIVDMNVSQRFYPADSLTRGDTARYIHRLIHMADTQQQT
ncbi:hypothetical protein GF369_04575 [Candidatus Peregrinibacteria bacterium]|nr:hypothetical protein [Candidatus Peregrinibacteria bacterium]